MATISYGIPRAANVRLTSSKGDESLTHIQEPIPPHSKAQGIIHPVTRQSDKRRRHRQVTYHFRYEILRLSAMPKRPPGHDQNSPKH